MNTVNLFDVLNGLRHPLPVAVDPCVKRIHKPLCERIEGCFQHIGQLASQKCRVIVRASKAGGRRTGSI